MKYFTAIEPIQNINTRASLQENQIVLCDEKQPHSLRSVVVIHSLKGMHVILCSNTSLKRPLKNRQNKGLKDKW